MMSWVRAHPILTFLIVLAILGTIRYVVRGPAPIIVAATP